LTAVTLLVSLEIQSALCASSATEPLIIPVKPAYS